MQLDVDRPSPRFNKADVIMMSNKLNGLKIIEIKVMFMFKYFKSLFELDQGKIDLHRGLRQFVLMLIPLLYGLIFNDFANALLATIGTFANIYVFKGTAISRLRSVTFASIALVLTMMFGTLTAGHTLLFGICLLIVAVVPHYIFVTLNIPGPSSTFFIIAFSLSSVMPIDPSAFLHRGLVVAVGGLFAILFVFIDIKVRPLRPEYTAVVQSFKSVQKMVESYNEQAKFSAMAKETVQILMATSEILKTSHSKVIKRSSDAQRLMLLHRIAEGIYSELLELNAKGQRPIPAIIVEMASYVTGRVHDFAAPSEVWKKPVHVAPEFENLVNAMYKVDEVIDMPREQVEKQTIMQSPQYWKRLRYHLTPESMNFISTAKYTLILGVSIFVALIFDFERAYWIPLSAHTVLIGGTTVANIERAGARWIGTTVGVTIAALFLLFDPNIVMVVAVLCLSGAVTEMIIGANYALAMIAISMQVILLGGLAQGNLSAVIAMTRVMDTTIGIVITIAGVMLIGSRLASKRLPEIMAEVMRIEAQIFHCLFSETRYDIQAFKHHDRLRLKINIENMEAMYRFAYGELTSNKKRIQYFYPAMFILEQMNFKLLQAIEDPKRPSIDGTAIAQYLLAFENVAKLFERGQRAKQMIDLPEMARYAQLRRSLMQLQEIALYDYQYVKNPNLLRDND